jgi:hypothetical protein
VSDIHAECIIELNRDEGYLFEQSNRANSRLIPEELNGKGRSPGTFAGRKRGLIKSIDEPKMQIGLLPGNELNAGGA